MAIDDGYVSLGGNQGRVAAQGVADGNGYVRLTCGSVVAEATVLRCAGPDVPIAGCTVALLMEVDDQGADTGRAAVMADDDWWGRRIQPAEFAPGPISERLVMGYRLGGQILHDGAPTADANVSLEGTLSTAEDGDVVFWDSEEFNELIYSDELDTCVEGTTVLAPIVTDAAGHWEYIVPKGHGALYQRAGDLRDDSDATRQAGLARWLKGLCAAYKGRKAAVSEGAEAVINILSGVLQITATPGACLRVATLDDIGALYPVPASGVVQVTGLPSGTHEVAQFRLDAWGAWDSNYGCPRAEVEVEEGKAVSLTMAPIEDYSGREDLVCGRVYQRPGVPAGGIRIVAVDFDSYSIVGTVATTGGDGYWSATATAQGLGGDLWILDSTWGCVPIIGTPYSDVVLGARVFASWQDEFRPRAWRKGQWGHDNFNFVEGSVTVVDAATGQEYATEKTAYGGWVTEAALPKYGYVGDITTLLNDGVALKQYGLRVDGEMLEPGITLRSQSFEDQETLPGQFRASGYYPEYQQLLGGKVHGHVVLQSDTPIKANLPEAGRVGLEYGDHAPYTEARVLPTNAGALSGTVDLICPYCGGPAYRDPDGAYLRGYCRQCADAFERADATDCRCYFRGPTTLAEQTATLRAVNVLPGREFAAHVAWHWRPDLYDETDDYVTQAGKGTATNAPRWFARHPDQVGDGKGLAKFDGDKTPAYQPGHDLAYFEALPTVNRALGCAQFKLVAAAGYALPQAVTVDVDCVRVDSGVETVRVTVPAGTKGPNSEDPYGDFVLLTAAPKLGAEQLASPYIGAGLYRGVSSIRLVDPPSAPGCRFSIVTDAPFLASPDGVPVYKGKSTPVALQIGTSEAQPHLFSDAVGQVFLIYSLQNTVWLRRRNGLEADWTPAVAVPGGKPGQEPWADKRDDGRLVALWQRPNGDIGGATSVDDGKHWEAL